MTMPVTGDQVAAGPAARDTASLYARIQTLEKRIEEISRKTLYSTVVSQGDVNIRGGSLNVYDTADNLVAVVGLLPNGGRGIAAVDPTGALVELSTLAFGMRSANALDEVILGTENVWTTFPDGPTISGVQIGSSGRALVMLSADILAAPTGSNTEVAAWLSFAIAGATTRSPQTTQALRCEYRRDVDTAGNPGVTISATRVVLVEGLNAGAHDFTAQYRMAEDTAADEASFLGRNLTVMPF